MEKVVIGIVPTSTLWQENTPYQDKYQFVNLYSKRIYELGGIPLGILPKDGLIESDTLSICDGIIIPGGNRIDFYVYQVIEEARKKKIPILGICMGMQAMAIYSLLLDKMDEIGNQDKWCKKYQLLKEKEHGSLLQELEVPNIHDGKILDRKQLLHLKHHVRIEESSLAYQIYQTEMISVYSLHHYTPKKIGSQFCVSGVASDGVMEIIESKDSTHFMMGVQFHPELENHSMLLSYFMKQVENQKRQRY